VRLFSDFEKTIERGFRKWTERVFGPAQSGELLLVHRGILEQIESKVQTVARGRRLFPYSRVTVTLASTDADRRALYASAFEEGGRLETEIREALQSVGCDIPRGFAVEVATAAEGEKAFTVEYGLAAPKQPEANRAPARLIAVKGKTEHDEYQLTKARTNIGRIAELTDTDERVVRRNDVVFEDGANEVNATVSRKHAHIELGGGAYRVCDDGSEFGTRVFRDGRQIEVPAGNRRGERLRPGDEIYFGRACLRFVE
jgi:FHA domain